MGQRSFSPWTFTPGVSDASLYDSDPFNVATSNKHIVLIPQIESVKGIENLEEIASVPGIGGLMFGPGDFMLDAGIPLKLGGDPDPRLAAAMGKMAAIGAKYSLPLLT
jgi:4-hydroxy-2-oxoheptanedioate aldolase